MKNVVFLTCIENSNYEYSIKTWEFWCKQHNCELVIYNTPSKHKITWQRWFDVFKQVEKVVPKYNKIFMVDTSSMVKWDAPNIFDLVDDRLTSWRDMDNLREYIIQLKI